MAKPMRQYLDWIWAAVAGGMLAVMVTLNSGLASYSTPFIASWVVHGVGAVAAIVLLQTSRMRSPKPADLAIHAARPPLWSYFGGAPGALAVALGSIAVNSSLALAGALSLMLVGQILFSLLSDLWGWFGTPKRPLNRFDLLAALLVTMGSALVIYSGGAS
ncbi:DMT family transporter [Rhizobium sp. PDO1-076]|uniref:DMT family transporter n=1 Tax=Rhizobium sp. PDO1-076 TaxID=1125979 RepID=UPI00031CFDE2|nr:DMT family transporter [Rhizobium sp. PDO1-076]